MKESMRKKSTRTASASEFDVASQLDVTSQSSDSVSQNPWASAASSMVNGEGITKQVSATSKSPDTTSPVRNIVTSPTIEEVPGSSPPAAQKLAVPGSTDDTNDEQKPTRRRKTVTKTPHTFELEADLTPVKTKDVQLPPPDPAKQDVPAQAPTKKKKKVVQALPPDGNMPNGPSGAQATPVPLASPRTPSAASVPATPVQPTPTPTVAVSPASPKPASPTPVAPVNPFASHRPKKSQSLSSVPKIFTSNPCRFTPPALPKESFHGKVIVMTNGASQSGQAMIKHFHAAGCRVLFGDTNPDQARKFISSLGPPHVVHFNKCDMTRYADMLELFKLAVTMYGRVDHAIFGVGDDGGQVSTVGTAEKGWFEDRPGMNKTAKMAYDEVATEPADVGDILTASIRFARIALAYLKYSPKAKASKKTFVNPYSTPQAEAPVTGNNDRSLTFVTSVAAFKETPLLPIYQVAQHSILGLVRSLRSSIDPDPERDGVRINAVVTNIMVPRAVAQSGGRSMSVQLPPDRPEDISRVVVGVVATNSTTPDINGADAPNGLGISDGGGVWYEKGFERGMREKHLHGRVIYSVGSEGWDIQEGLDRSEAAWMGQKPTEVLTRNMAGLGIGVVGGVAGGGGSGSQSSWILDMI
jgi:NAD(P)-dependent dehydrogenase (short-subunit alcohol dehydrogenase family)